MSWKTELKSPNVIQVKFDNINQNWEQWILCRSDAHHDNVHCNRKMEYRHLDEAVQRSALICDVGDRNCLMQGSWDPRKDQSQLRPEHQVNNYLDAVIESTADDYQKYAHNWLFMGDGNHETNIEKRHQTNVSQRLTAIINARKGSSIYAPGYSGWVQFKFQRKRSRQRAYLNYWFFHGKGVAPVTEGMINSARERAFIENADIMHTGHNHKLWQQCYAKVRCTEQGNLQRRNGIYIKTSGYKDEYGQGQGGWSVQSGHPPIVNGAFWIRFYLVRGQGNLHEKLRMQAIQAN